MSLARIDSGQNKKTASVKEDLLRSIRRISSSGLNRDKVFWGNMRRLLSGVPMCVYTVNSVPPRLRSFFKNLAPQGELRPKKVVLDYVGIVRRNLTKRSARAEKSRSPTAASDKLSLTPREEQILYWIAQGKSNAQIGKILSISSATVGKHLEHIYPKLGVENRTAAASFVPREKL